jgi:hypothetical protein
VRGAVPRGIGTAAVVAGRTARSRVIAEFRQAPAASRQWPSKRHRKRRIDSRAYAGARRTKMKNLLCLLIAIAICSWPRRHGRNQPPKRAVISRTPTAGSPEPTAAVRGNRSGSAQSGGRAMHCQPWSAAARGTFDVAVGGLGVLANEIDVCKIARQAAVTDLQEIQTEVRSQIRKA